MCCSVQGRDNLWAVAQRRLMFGRAEVEPDQKHVGALVADVGFGVGNAAATRRTSWPSKAEESEEFKVARTTPFRSGAMRAAYPAQDRVDIAEAVISLAMYRRRFREAHLIELKHHIRCITGKRRCELLYFRKRVEDSPSPVHVDLDWTGDFVGRSSTRDVVMRRGVHLLRHMSMLQTPIGLRSVESEIYALTREGAIVLGGQPH